ncbi:thioredoxin family protein [Thioalbus denitrificans]|uniref:Thioredoxin n=1 Tax=Thioalbus denitrificans TaxID=547122 RepID=A0A369CIG2_9GAMM|nr:thioredoxin family protein [Thioalbus denitrificans]RCX33483.1 thioredoxin [Thioalbus denitrificans]
MKPVIPTSATAPADRPAAAIWFSAPGCGVCSVLRPRVKSLFEQEFPQILWQDVDTAAQPEVAAQHQVFTIPTLLVFLDGREFLRRARNFSPAEVRDALARPYGLLFGDA